MNLRLGIYDIFSRMVPGVFYIFVIINFTNIIGWTKITWTNFGEIKLIPALIILVASYIIGVALDLFGAAWHRLFKKRGMSDRVLKEFKLRHSPSWKFEFTDKEWTLLLSYIRIQNSEIADEISRHNAQCIMLRNVSLGSMMLAIIEIIQFVRVPNLTIITLAVVLVALSIMLGIQARTLRGYYYRDIFESVIAYRINLEERIKSVGSLQIKESVKKQSK